VVEKYVGGFGLRREIEENCVGSVGLRIEGKG